MKMCGFILVIALISLAGCCTNGFKQIETKEGTFAVPNCCPMIKYSGTSIAVRGVDIALSNVPVKIGEVTVKPETIQAASEIVQILEQHRMTTCQLLPSYASVSKAKFIKALEAKEKDERVLTQFALVVASKDGKALLAFVKAYGPQTKYLALQASIDKEFTMLKGFEPSASFAVVPLDTLIH